MFSIPLEKMVSHYGYIAIVIGTFLEGETILVLGGFPPTADTFTCPG